MLRYYSYSFNLKELEYIFRDGDEALYRPHNGIFMYSDIEGIFDNG